jgi:class 3 adenylate cyclase/outer membrane protein assembly factor BamB
MPERRIATVVMLDMVGSTQIAAHLGDARYRELSSRFSRSVRDGLKRFGGREEDNAGDGFFLTFSQPDRAIRFAATLANEVRGLGIEIRSGIHTGQAESHDGKTQGIAVVIGARVMSLAGPGEVLVTGTTKELVTGSEFGFEDLSAHELKGVPGTWQVFGLTSVNRKERGGPLPAQEALRRLESIEARSTRGPRLHRASVVGGIVGLAAIAAVVIALLPHDVATPRAAGSNGPSSKSVVNIDPESGEILSTIPAPVSQQGGPAGVPPTSAHPIAIGEGAIWSVRSYRLLYHIDPEDEDVETQIVLEGGLSFPYNVAVGLDKVWVSCARGLIAVNPATNEQSWVMQFEAEGSQFGTDLAIGGGAVWVGGSDGRLIRFDPSSGRRRTRWGLDPIDAITFGHGSVWTVDTFGGAVSRYDPDSLDRIARIPIPAGVDALIAGDEAVWALSRSLGTLTEVDVTLNRRDHILPVGTTPIVLTAGAGSVWVGHEDGTLQRIDEETRQVTPVAFGPEIRGLAFDDETDTIWVDVA